ncbi:MAG TPA: hypothetical protein VJ826_08860 [Candidatus Polarisedimenticolaceae bacterium]|nr:hypothetical protein [Candidatus Polarisedimenticolaceae bacterium]
MAVPRDYFARLDGTLTTALGHDGRTWSVWSYRAVGEYDVAIAVRDLDGTWSPATFLGRRDGVDQVEPSIAVDADGNVYVAFATRSPQRIWTSVLPSGRSTWSEPSILALDEAATAPALRVVRDRLVIAVRSARGIRMIDLPLYVAPNTDQGIQDGPDTQGPLGNEGRDLPIGDGPSGDPPPPPPPPGDGASSNS